MAKSEITIVEVGPRDGLQNEPINIPTQLKIQLIDALSQTGLKMIEVSSFVSPKWIPQLADHTEVMNGIKRNPNVTYCALVPNEHGLDEAIKANTQQVAVFLAASETFSIKNTNAGIEQNLARAKTVIDKAKLNNIPTRGYISCVLGCPYEGKIELKAVATLAEQLIDLGCYQVSLGDTIGIGTANKAKQLIQTVNQSVDIEKIAVHFHDTYAQALTNIYQSLELGVTTIDSAVAGLGGCPYAPGAGGNVATEDVIYLLEGLGINPGIDMVKLAKAGRLICDYLKQPPRSKASLALLA